MLTRIHVNSHKIRGNRRHGTQDPVLTVRQRGHTFPGSHVAILGPDGLPFAQVVYRPEKPLNCGAVVWIETRMEVRLDGAPLDLSRREKEPACPA